jgi:ATP-dependent helicase YprA (DUF1998 family)
VLVWILSVYRGKDWVCRDLLLLLLRRLQDLERAQQALVDTHHRTCVVELATVVRRGEEGDELAFAEELVAVFDDLVGTTDEVHVVFLKEAGDDVRAEGEGDTAIVLAPACDVLVGIGPEKIAKQTAVGNLQKC